MLSITHIYSANHDLLFLFQAPHPQSGRRHENILPAHQPRLYTGHQSHPYAHHPRVSSEPGASAQRIHEMQCPAAFMNRPTAASLLVPDMPNPQQPTSAAPTLVSIGSSSSYQIKYYIVVGLLLGLITTLKEIQHINPWSYGCYTPV